MKKYLFPVCLVIALLGAGFAGWVDFHNDEPQPAVLVILVVTFLLGMALPARAWLWGLLLGLGVPGYYLVAHALGHQPVSPPSPAWYASLLALIPGMLGAYAGVLARTVGGSLFRPAKDG